MYFVSVTNPKFTCRNYGLTQVNFMQKDLSCCLKSSIWRSSYKVYLSYSRLNLVYVKAEISSELIHGLNKNLLFLSQKISCHLLPFLY